MSISTRLFTWWNGKLVGKDEFGNLYYEDRQAKAGTRPRRWVIYDGEVEASKVPPEAIRRSTSTSRCARSSPFVAPS